MMKSLLELVTKLKYSALILVFGALVLLPAIFTGISISKFEPAPRVPPSIVGLAIASVLILVSIFAFVSEAEVITWVGQKFAKRTSTRFTACFDRLKVNIVFGRLEKYVETIERDARQLVLLPTNEFFDDDCFNAKRTACGAYINSVFEGRMDLFKSQFTIARQSLNTIGRYEKTSGLYEDSFGAGSALYLASPIGSTRSLLFTAVTTKRFPAGLASHPGYLFQCVEQLAYKVSDFRITNVCMPLIGSGEGRLSSEAALMSILLSLSVMQTRLRSFDPVVHIVIFQNDDKTDPEIRRSSARRILNLAAQMHESTPALQV